MYLCFIFKPHNKILICKPIRKDPSGEKADIIDRIRLNKQATKKPTKNLFTFIQQSRSQVVCVCVGGGVKKDFPGGGGFREIILFAIEGGVLPAHTNIQA